jgi:hypothetical protein
MIVWNSPLGHRISAYVLLNSDNILVLQANQGVFLYAVIRALCITRGIVWDTTVYLAVLQVRLI